MVILPQFIRNIEFMTLKELEKLVLSGETLHVEFKHKVNFPEKIAREIVAFTNTYGGKLLIGVDDNKTIFGLKNAAEEIFAVKNVFEKYIKFPVSYSLEQIKINDKKDVIVVHIPEGELKPNYAFENPGQKDGIAYVRVKDKSVQASHEVRPILKLRSEGRSVPLNFGNIEKNIASYIERRGFITVKSLQEMELLSRPTASQKLIDMCLAGILDFIPEEKGEDQYFMKM